MLFNKTQIKGLTTELVCMQKLIQYGYIVSIPYGNNSRYDLLIDTGNHFFRLQCKTALLNENGSYTINTANSNSHSKTIKHYKKEDIDFIISVIEDFLIVIPVSMIENSRSKVFRIDYPQYGSKSNCNLIQNYTFEKQILPLIT